MVASVNPGFKVSAKHIAFFMALGAKAIEASSTEGTSPLALTNGTTAASIGGDEALSPYFDLGVTTIVARECLEAGLIMSNYFGLIKRSDRTPEQKARAKKLLGISTGASVGTAAVLITGLGIGLHYAGQELSDEVAEYVEGASKFLAAFCVGHMSVKIPKWLGLYKKRAERAEEAAVDPVNQDVDEPVVVARAVAQEEGKVQELVRSEEEASETSGVQALSSHEKKMFFDIFWNIFRETAEIGVFILPFALAGEGVAIPLSALAGVGLAGVASLSLFLSERFCKCQNDCLPYTYVTLTALLASALFSGACHEFEEVLGETPEIFDIQDTGWSHKELPMALLAPLGYSSSPSILETTSFWAFSGALVGSHFLAKHFYFHPEKNPFARCKKKMKESFSRCKGRAKRAFSSCKEKMRSLCGKRAQEEEAAVEMELATL